MNTKNKNAYAIISEYETLFYDYYGRKPIINKYKESWGIKSMIDHIGVDGVRELLRYYFKTGKTGHPLDFFINNYDKLIQSKSISDSDRIARQKILEQTRKLVEGER